MTTLQVEKKANELMTQHGLIDKGWTFVLDNAKTRFGCCKYRKKHITISKFLLPHVANDSDVIDTILHEIAHALVGGGHGHNHIWKAKAREIGCRGERCGTGKIKDTTKLNQSAKWIGKCVNGHIATRHKMTAKAKRVSCGECSNRYDPKYKFVWEKNN